MDITIQWNRRRPTSHRSFNTN